MKGSVLKKIIKVNEDNRVKAVRPNYNADNFKSLLDICLKDI